MYPCEQVCLFFVKCYLLVATANAAKKHDVFFFGPQFKHEKLSRQFFSKEKNVPKEKFTILVYVRLDLTYFIPKLLHSNAANAKKEKTKYATRNLYSWYFSCTRIKWRKYTATCVRQKL